MLEIIKQLALDVAEQGADLCTGRVTGADPLRILLEEGMELTEEFLILTESVLDWEESGQISINNNTWNYYRIRRDGRLKVGERVSLLRAADGQQYLVMGRMEKGGGI